MTEEGVKLERGTLLLARVLDDIEDMEFYPLTPTSTAEGNYSLFVPVVVEKSGNSTGIAYLYRGAIARSIFDDLHNYLKGQILAVPTLSSSKLNLAELGPKIASKTAVVYVEGKNELGEPIRGIFLRPEFTVDDATMTLQYMVEHEDELQKDLEFI